MHEHIQPQVEVDPRQAEADRFVHTSAQDALHGLGYSGFPPVEFGHGVGWSCDITPENPSLVIDLDEFGGEGDPEQFKILSFQHEIDAHYAKSILQPESAQWDIDWGKEHPGGVLFLNIMADIAGNREIATKDALADWSEIYSQKLFKETDFRFKHDENGAPTDKPLPRHVQMMYAAIREKMVPDEQCIVDDEVRSVLDELQQFNGEIDILDFSTQPFKSETEYMSRMEQMRLWRKTIWPKYLELYDKDLEDKKEQGQQNQGGQDGQPGEQSQDGSDNNPFAEEHAQYEEQHHPGGKPNKSEDESPDSPMQQVMQTIIDGAPDQPSQPDAEKQQQQSDAEAVDQPKQSEKARPPEKQRKPNQIEQFAREHGVETKELQSYLTIQSRVQPVIAEMHTVFEQFVNERTAPKWRLSHQHEDGVLLDPDNLARTMIQIKTGNLDDAKPYMDYEHKEGVREMSGKFDAWLVVDRSGSMAFGDKATKAKEGAVAILEGLDDFNRIVAEQSRMAGQKLDFDARTGIVAFGSSAETVKPLSGSLTLQERMKAVDGISPRNESTADFLALDQIKQYYDVNPHPNRNKIVIVLTDGQSNDPSALKQRIASLQSIPKLGISAIGIQDGHAEANYAPHGKTLQRVEELPATLAGMVTRMFS